MSPLHRVTVSSCHPITLVVGYGNELRGDDAVGPRIAGEVAAWELAEVRTLAVHQLTPELAEELARADAAMFVDAYRTDAAEATVSLRPIAAHNRAQLGAHLGDPSALLALTHALYGQYPRAWLISVPASSFEYGADLSPIAKAGVANALHRIRYLIRSVRGEPYTGSV